MNKLPRLELQSNQASTQKLQLMKFVSPRGNSQQRYVQIKD
jgi:hypothetical protein